MRVLVVEDHAKLALAIAAVLRREGMAVDVAFDGDDALAKTAVSRYDVIVLDRDLPGRQCWSAVTCRSTPPGGSPPGAGSRLSSAPRSSRSWNCFCPLREAWSRPRNCWNGSGTRQPTRSPTPSR